jgi:hypothetical protein
MDVVPAKSVAITPAESKPRPSWSKLEGSIEIAHSQVDDLDASFHL